MMKALKAIGFGFAAVVLVVVLAALALLLFVDPNRYRGTIETQARAVSGREVTIGGQLKLGFYPFLALDVGRISIGNPEGFGAEPMLSAERVRVGAKFLPLLRGELRVSRVALDGLVLNLARHADGHTNWELPARAERPAEPSAGPAAVSIDGLDVARASLTLRDAAAKSVTRVRKLELHTGALGGERPADLTVAAEVDAGEGTATTRLSLATRATLDVARSRALLEALKLSGERTGATPSAKPLPFALESPRIALDWKAGTLEPATFGLKLGSLPLTVEVAAERLFGERRLTGRFRMPEQSLRTLAPSLGVALPATRGPATFTRLAASGSFKVTGTALAITDLDVALDRTKLRGRVGLDGADRPSIEFDVHLDSIDVDAYRAPEAAASSAKAPPPARLPFEALRAIDVRGTVVLERATLAGLTLSDVRLPVSLQGGALRASPSLKAFGGKADGDVRLDASREPASLVVTEQVAGIDLGAAIKAYAKSDRLSGHANASVRLTGSGSTDAALVASLAGPIDVEVHDGALEGLDVAYEIGRAQSLLKGQAPVSRAGATRTPFTALNARSRLDHGVLTTDALALETVALKVTGTGSLRLADQSVDYRLLARVQEVPATGADPGLAGLRSLEVPVSVTGTVQNYKVRPDLSGVVKGRVKQELDKQKDKLRESLKDKLKDLFKN